MTGSKVVIKYGIVLLISANFGIKIMGKKFLEVLFIRKIVQLLCVLQYNLRHYVGVFTQST